MMHLPWISGSPHLGTLCGISGGYASVATSIDWLSADCPLCLARRAHGPLTRLPAGDVLRLISRADALRDRRAA
jgi:hypothetical protein